MMKLKLLPRDNVSKKKRKFIINIVININILTELIKNSILVGSK